MARPMWDNPESASGPAPRAAPSVDRYLRSEHELFHVEFIGPERVLLEDCRTGTLLDVPVSALAELTPVAVYGAAGEVPQPSEAPTPIVPDAPSQPMNPDPAAPAAPELPAEVPAPDQPATPIAPEPGPDAVPEPDPS